MQRSSWLRAPLRLDSHTVRPFVVHHLLPRILETAPQYNPLRARLLSAWSMDERTGGFDENTVRKFFVALGKFSAGRLFLDTAILNTLNVGLREAFGALQVPMNMRRLLEAAQFVTPGDNIHRLLSDTKLQLPDGVMNHVGQHIAPLDPFDTFRTCTSSNIYAIDSATTSEVDDAIGIDIDSHGRERITVYVSDATAYVPFDSDLELLSGRAAGTTVYLPEGVYFMLPKPIIEAATLRSGARCRTFNISFYVTDDGKVTDYNVSVGFTDHLQRITYDAAQDLISSNLGKPVSSSPAWMQPADCEKMSRLYKIGQLLSKRQVASVVNLPDPYVRVDKETKTVLKVADQVTSCADAYNMVAAFMIAANEVCSRIAQEEKVCIPFRGSRPLSSFHEAAKEYVRPHGAVPHGLTHASQLTSEDAKFASSVLAGLDKLRGTSRALYHHTPLLHNGLNTTFYCHSTSPLRRYPDMLVHHQLKCMISQKRGQGLLFPIEDFQMAELCQASSNQQLAADLMQIASTRYWILKYLQDTVVPKKPLLRCIVGFTHDVGGCPDEPRQLAGAYRFRSDVFIPDVQLLHTVHHNDASVSVGSELHCQVEHLQPETDVLTLRLISARPPVDGATRAFTKLAKAAD
jgi:hypothetical protein